MDSINLWMNYESYKKYNEYRKYLESKWWAWAFYGIHPGQYPEFEEFQSCDRSRGIPLKNSSEVLKGDWNTTLLRLKERNNLLQNETVCIPGSPIKSLNSIQYRIAIEIFTNKIRGALRKINESKV